MRLQLLRREDVGFGATLLVEPSVARFDELTGIRASRVASENALLLDTAIIPDKVYGAINVIYDLERTRERGASATERGSTAGVAAALSFRMSPEIFVGGEVRYLRAYDGLAFNRLQGEALFVGPTLFAALTAQLSVTAAYSVQIAGSDAAFRRQTDEGGVPGNALINYRSSRDLISFERHQVRLKLVYDF
ncbi:hypothetical protein [Methylobacterium oxalidis]|uniref:hypothetical protein n=1 Tax=Methylobacterium oxalidis TaxID=944322 RepID=UPI0033164A11